MIYLDNIKTATYKKKNVIHKLNKYAGEKIKIQPKIFGCKKKSKLRITYINDNDLIINNNSCVKIKKSKTNKTRETNAIEGEIKSKMMSEIPSGMTSKIPSEIPRELTINFHKGLVIIPERCRSHQQDKILNILSNYLPKYKYTIVIVHQNNDNLFNKGMLINIGVYMARQYSIDFDYIIIHDIDMYMIEPYDYSYFNGVCRMKGIIENYCFGNKPTFKSIKKAYDGGITIINYDNFIKVNGFDTIFEGWGCEDTNFIKRCKNKHIDMEIRNGHFESSPNDRKNPMFVNNKLSAYKTNYDRGYSNLNSNAFKCYHDTRNNNIYEFYVSFDTQYYHKVNYVSYKINLIKNLNIIKIGTVDGGMYFINFIIHILNVIYPNKKIEVSTDLFKCDIIIGSLFKSKQKEYFIYSAYKIFICGEPRRDLKQFNYDFYINTIFDGINSDKNYLYIPQYSMAIYELKRYSLQTHITKTNRKYCAYMYSHCCKHREHIFKELNKYNHIDAIGMCCSEFDKHGKCIKSNINNRLIYTNDNTYLDEAIDKYSDYKFVLAVENTDSNGYITEKILLPILAGAIPIYWGTSYVKICIPQKAYIYINDYKSLHDCYNHINDINNNESLYNQYIQEGRSFLKTNKYFNIDKHHINELMN